MSQYVILIVVQLELELIPESSEHSMLAKDMNWYRKTLRSSRAAPSLLGMPQEEELATKFMVICFNSLRNSMRPIAVARRPAAIGL